MDKDIELVRAFMSGDSSSYMELVSKYKDRVYRIAFSMRQNSNDAAQEIFLKV